MTFIMHNFQVFTFNSILMCVCISCRNVYLSVCYQLAKIDHTGGPETFFNFA